MTPRPPVPMRDGVGPSTVALCHGPWHTVLEFLAHRLPRVSLDTWRQRMEAGDVFDEQGHPLPVNAPFPDARQLAGRRVHYFRSDPTEPEPPEGERILFEDDVLLVADKPHWMAVTPGGRHIRHSLLARLKRRTGCESLSPLHRIDRETAGLVLFSKRAQDRNAYQRLFREQALHKRYWAVAPHPPTVALPCLHRSHLVPSADFFRMQALPAATGGYNSATRIALLDTRPGIPWGLYALEPITGKRHQLRVHMAELGMPIAWDAFYPVVLRAADAVEDWQRPLQLLAQSVSFTDPITHTPRSFESTRSLIWPPVATLS